MYLISTYFDDRSNQILQRYIERIAVETKNRFMTEHNVPPHMTISSIEAKNVELLKPYFSSLQKKTICGEIQFVSVGQLLPYVFYVTPVMNDYLWNLSRQIYDTFHEIPDISISKYYQPSSWLPHVTLGKCLTKQQMQIAFALMQDQFVPFTAHITEIGLSKVNPLEDVMRFTV